MGPTWPNLGRRCAPDSLTLLNIGPTKANKGVTYAPQTQVTQRPAVRRKPLNPGAAGPCPCRRPSVGNRRLYTLAPPAADPFVGPPVYLRPTPCRPRVDRFICILRRLFKKCSKTSFFYQGAGGVGYACRVDKLNRHFVGVGRISRLTYPQHRPKIANISPTYAQHSFQDGST